MRHTNGAAIGGTCRKSFRNSETKSPKDWALNAVDHDTAFALGVFSKVSEGCRGGELPPRRIVVKPAVRLQMSRRYVQMKIHAGKSIVDH
jgi:hypothetical protein